jgi:hypothetical protein
VFWASHGALAQNTFEGVFAQIFDNHVVGEEPTRARAVEIAAERNKPQKLAAVSAEGRLYGPGGRHPRFQQDLEAHAATGQATPW